MKRKKRGPPPPLSGLAAMVFELLIDTPPHRAMLTSSILSELASRGRNISESTFSRHLLPSLRAWGVKNKPRVGYYVTPKGRQMFERLLHAHHALLAKKAADGRMVTT